MTKLKMNIATKEDSKAENGRLKRELEVREKAIKDLEMKLEDKDLFIKRETVSKPMYDSTQEQLARRNGEVEKLRGELRKMNNDAQRELSKFIHLDAECENLREQLRQAREESVKYGKENEHLWGLLKIKMEG